MNAVFLCNNAKEIERVYGQGRRQQLGDQCCLYAEVIGQDQFSAYGDLLAEIEVVFSTWGMWVMTPAELAALPKLRAVFYAAGSVKVFAAPLLAQGIQLFSGWGANAVPVAEFTLAQILLSCKGYFRDTQDCADQEQRVRGRVEHGPGVFGTRVGLIGAGMVGRKLIELLQPFALEVLVYDPYLSTIEAMEMGVELVALETLFERSFVVSNHLPNVGSTCGLLDQGLFERLPPNATFINTARGAQVEEEGLIRVCRSRQDITALLDVSEPEPPRIGSPLYTLPNVQLSSHIAGSMGREVVRMADYMIAEFLAWQAGQPLRYEVTEPMLEHLA